MAMAVFTWARTDGGHEAWGRRAKAAASYVPPSGPGQWTATPPAFARAAAALVGREPPPSPPGRRARPGAAAGAYSEAPGSAFHRDAQGLADQPPGHAGAAPGRALLGRRSGQDADAGRSLGLHRDRPAEAAQGDARPTRRCSTRANDRARRRVHRVRGAPNYSASTCCARSPTCSSSSTADWTPTLMDTPPFPEYTSGHSVVSRLRRPCSLRGPSARRRSPTTRTTTAAGVRERSSFAAAADDKRCRVLYAGIPLP